MEKNKINNVDKYISLFSLDTQMILKQIRQTIKKAIPEAEEVISYNMPAFKFHGILVWFAAFKKHYSIFIRPKILQVFKEELKQYELTKSAIKTPYGNPVPVKLITKIIKYAAKENLKKAELIEKTSF
jgi:uncharacterized protein YdhG (YjbR/CyaY superfamily)